MLSIIHRSLWCRPSIIHSIPALTSAPFRLQHQETRLTIYQDVKRVRHAPLPALSYGLAGLLPFTAVPAYFLVSHSFCPTLAFAQTAYGATILAFLGGVRWGAALFPESGLKPSWRNLGISVTPSLVAWVALVIPMPVSDILLMTGLAGMMYTDLREPTFPSWFRGLRFVLSTLAILALWSTVMCSMALSEVENEKDEEKKND